VKVTELIQKMELSIETEGVDSEITGCYMGDILSLALSDIFQGNIWITAQTNINIVAVAFHNGASCIILPNGFEPDNDARECAQNKKIYILSSNKTAYELGKTICTLI